MRYGSGRYAAYAVLFACLIVAAIVGLRARIAGGHAHPAAPSTDWSAASTESLGQDLWVLSPRVTYYATAGGCCWAEPGTVGYGATYASIALSAPAYSLNPGARVAP